MFSGGFRGQKLKTSLRLSINRLKLMEKKKTEMAQKARKEIADFISMNKYDRARIRVEHIIREDYLVEAMELVELYCDLLLARFGLIESMKYCDEGLVESVSSIIWASPRLSTDCQELKSVADQLTFKYGKEFGMQARSNATNTVNERLIHKLRPDAPPKILVERYLIEIARNYNVAFDPDPDVMMSEGIPSVDSKEFEAIGNPTNIGFNGFNDSGNVNNYGPHPPGGGSFPGGNSGGSGYPGGGSNFGGGGDIPSNPYPPPSKTTSYPPDNEVPPYSGHNRNLAYPPADNNPHLPPYTPNTSQPGGGSFLNAPPPSAPGGSSIPDLPDIPTGGLSSVGGQSEAGDDVDFDDLTRRFAELKKKK